MKKLMLFIALAVLALVVMPANIQAQRVHPEVNSGTSSGNRVAPHVAVGGGWTTTILLINLGISPETYTLRIYGDSGSPQAVPFQNAATQTDLGMQSVLTGTIPVGGVVSYKAQDIASSTTTGWASLDPSSTGSIGAQVVFRYLTGQEATALLETLSSQRFYLAFDNTNGSATGVALVNPQEHAVTVHVQFRDLNGLPLSNGTFTMAPMEHTSFMLADKYPTLANLLGTALFTTDSAANAIAALGILSTPAIGTIGAAGAMTTLFPMDAQ
ncbi:MAG: hypothetical protein DMG58_16825 [Acidobacteria bacterium]|nr:MAG: hypothetical protein DMG58_16825 [Acidobacteriota bacterium]